MRERPCYDVESEASLLILSLDRVLRSRALSEVTHRQVAHWFNVSRYGSGWSLGAGRTLCSICTGWSSWALRARCSSRADRTCRTLWANWSNIPRASRLAQALAARTMTT